MSSPEESVPRYRVHCSGEIHLELRRLQRRAARLGRGEAFLAAFREIVQRLKNDPNEVGEPLYHLPAMRLQIRCAVVRPLSMDFAVNEDLPLVFIKAVHLMSEP